MGKRNYDPLLLIASYFELIFLIFMQEINFVSSLMNDPLNYAAKEVCRFFKYLTPTIESRSQLNDKICAIINLMLLSKYI